MANIDTFRLAVVAKALEEIRRASDLYNEGSAAWEDYVVAVLMKLIEDWH